MDRDIMEGAGRRRAMTEGSTQAIGGPLGISGPAGGQTPALPLEQQRASCLYRPASREMSLWSPDRNLKTAATDFKEATKGPRDPSTSELSARGLISAVRSPQRTALGSAAGPLPRGPCQKFVAWFGPPRRRFAEAFGFPYERVLPFAHCHPNDLPFPSGPGGTFSRAC